MKTNTHQSVIRFIGVPRIFWGMVLFGLLTLAPWCRADDSAVGKTKESIKETTEDVKVTAEELWGRVDEARLKNRTPDQIAAWAIIGVLVGAIAGMATSLKTTGIGKLGRLLFGLVGSFLGGIIVSVTRVNFGWGPVLVSYEELLFSFVGAIGLLVLSRFARSSWKQKAK
jgi:uncharacterized membrane protein YeaQ/YmgE (transglycosylase-associated protein family)